MGARLRWARVPAGIAVVRYGGPFGGIIDGAWSLSGSKDEFFQMINTLYSPVVWGKVYEGIGSAAYEMGHVDNN